MIPKRCENVTVYLAIKKITLQKNMDIIYILLAEMMITNKLDTEETLKADTYAELFYFCYVHACLHIPMTVATCFCCIIYIHLHCLRLLNFLVDVTPCIYH